MNNIQYYPLTHCQKSIWYTEKMYPNTSISNIAATLRFKGEFDPDLLEQAINIFIQKNDSMRMRILEDDGVPRQYVSDYKYQKFDFVDFSKYKNPIEELFKWDQEQTVIPLKTVTSQLFDYKIIKINDHDGGFYIKIHHLISDAWTMTLMGTQIEEYYSALKKGVEVSTDKLPSYIEYIKNEEKYEESDRFIKDKEYWSGKFETLPEMTVLKNRTTNQINSHSKRKTLVTPIKFTRKLREYCAQNNITPFPLFLSALSMYINRVSSKEDIVLGIPVLNRSNKIERNTTGMFMSTAPVCLNVNSNFNFKEFSQILSKECMSLLRHQKYPYESLLKDLREKHKMSGNLFDIVLSYQNSKFEKEKSSEEYATRWHFNGDQIESLIINVNDREDEGHLIIDYDFLDDLFFVKEIEFIHQHIITLLWHAIDNPEREISKLEMVSEKEKHKILYEFNNTKADYPKDKTIHQIFEEQVVKTPDNIAVVFEDKQLTYRELNEKSNQLARVLREKGVKQDTIVGIEVYRSLEMVIGIMAIIKAGGAYLPIDPTYPRDRKKYILENSNTAILLTQESLIDKNEFDGEIINLDDNRIYSGDGSNLNHINKPNDLVYIIYTSGSTGKPKGAMIEHRSLINRINWMQKKYPISESSVILQKTPYTFDVSVWELFWWSFVGARVCMLEPCGEKDPAVIIDAINKHKITTMHFVPSMLSMFLQYLEGNIDIKKLSSLKQVFASGEALSLQHVSNFNSLLHSTNRTELYNLYGPTEATVDVSYFDCSPEVKLKSVPIGKPIDNIQLYIVDKNNNLLPVGVPGELCIGGDGVARGYLNKPDLTKEKFVPNPFIEGEKMYRTGDLARWYPQGDIEYLGRFDFQLKIRGFRIELGEIENKLLLHRHIKDVVVVGKGEGSTKYLCAYYTSDKALSNSELKAHLLNDLPEYMVPTCFMKLDKLPLSSNGKVDRKSLPEPNMSSNSETKVTPPRNEVDEILVKTIEDALNIKGIGIDNNLFDLGGDSLTVIQILSKVYKYNWRITATDFYKYNTIRELSDRISGELEEKIEPLQIEIENIEPKEEATNISKVEKLENILLTGATGFLGAHILSQLIDCTKANIYCLIRGETEDISENKMRKILEFYFKDNYSDLIRKRIFIINGDVALDKLGLTDKEYDILGNKIDTIIHSAAIVKYYGDYSEIEKVNVFGTKKVVDFALRYGAKLNQISTVSITGDYLVDNRNIKNARFTENDFYVGQNYLDNVYVRSKFEAENLIHKAMKQGLRASIFRIGNLAGRYSDGQFQHNISDNAFYSAIKSIIQLGAVSKEILNEEVEFTPVDLASRAIVEILKTKESCDRNFHIFNHHILRIRDVAEIINRIGIEVKIAEKEKLRNFIEKSSENRLNTNTTSAIAYLNEIGEMMYTDSFVTDSTITQNYLTKLAFEWPKVSEEYIFKLIEHMRSVNYI